MKLGERSLDCGRKKAGESVDFVPSSTFWYDDMIRSSERWQVNDEYWMNISVIPRKIPTCARILLKLMHPSFKNIMSGHITSITCYWQMCNRINASRVMGGIKYSLQFPRFFLSPRQRSPRPRFSISPLSSWEPVHRLIVYGQFNLFTISTINKSHKLFIVNVT